jgi:methylmalonyl-CoA/ethylmalonyl-CoA epimerase
MKALKLDHVGIAVASIDEALSFYRDILGLELAGVEIVEEQKVRTAFLPIGGVHGSPLGGAKGVEGEGRTEIELLESTDPEGPIGRYIAAKGEGVQHIALQVEDLDAALAELKAAGIRLIDETPRRGAGGKRIAFLHPKSTRGVLVELCEPMALS